jgi:serine/threonine-protein kinase
VPWVKVLDFGISKMLPSGLTEAEATLTRSIGLIGSPFYMSPEQVRAPRSVDARSDVWAIGVILYQLLSGRAPFTGQSVPELSVKIAVEAAPSLPPNLPAAVASVVYRCLEKEREARFQTVADLADALAPFAPERARMSAVRARELLGSAPRSSSPDVRSTERTPSSSGAPEAKTALTVSAWVQKAPPRRIGFVALAAAIGALTLAGLAWFERDGGAPPVPLRSGSPLAEGTRGVEVSLRAPIDSAQSQAPPGLSAAPSSSTAPAVAHSSGPTARSAAAPASSGPLRAGLASTGASGESRPVTVRSPPSEPRSTPEPSASPVQQSPFDVRKW